MNMGLHIGIMAVATILMPVLAQVGAAAEVNADSGIIKQLMFGGSQVILAIIVGVEALVIRKMWMKMNADTERHQEYMQNEAKMSTKVISDNSVALQANADSVDELRTELRERKK